jgi:outer membrane protein assembly factor BamB
LITLGAAGHLFCLDAVTGDVVWEKSLGKAYGLEAFSGITPSPLIDGDRVILFICAKPDACLVALDRNSGVECWRALEDSFTYSSPIIVTAGGQRQLIVWSQEAVTSLDPATGRTWWRERFRTPGDTAVSTPVFSDHRLLLGGLMLKLDRDKPAMTVLWPDTKAVSRRVLSNTSTPLLRGDHVYSAKTTGELVCLDAASGNQVWKADTVTDLKNGSSIHLTLNGDSVLLFTNEGNLIRARLSPRAYEELGRVRLIEPTHPFNGRNVVWPPPAFANRRVFVRSDRELVCASLDAAPRD